MEELKKLKRISKEVVSKQDHKKVRSLNNLQEKKDALKFLILSGIKLRHMELDELLNESKDQEEFKLLLLKAATIPPKITLLQQNFQEKDFKKILALLDELELRLLGDESL